MSKWTSRICAVALAAVAMVTAANALPIGENTIRNECKLANGVYTSDLFYNAKTRKNDRYSICTYADSRGDWYTDFYVNGEYQYTVSGVFPPSCSERHSSEDANLLKAIGSHIWSTI